MMNNMELPLPPPEHDPNQAPRVPALAPLRPTTIFEPEDPTLDPSAITHSQPPPDRLLPGMLSLGIYGALILGWAFLATRIDRNFPTAFLGSERTMDVLLEPEAASKPIPEAKEVPFAGKDGGPAGGPHSRDPLADTEFPNAKVANLDRTDFVLYANPPLPLPLAPGDGGMSTGPGSGAETGSRMRAGTGFGKTLDYELIATHKVELHYQLGPGQTQSPCVIVIAIQIEADGHVSLASAVSGPAYLYSAGESAARQWTFEPLAAHGLRAPYRIKIIFHYKK